ncbi:MAG: hypothetical protein F4X72_10835 [Dehalococcoidia bacterium]|nr:hypothetical protein [Dehalococcoidia bacterium]
MRIEVDEGRWPDLTRFRKACLADDVETMQEIVRKEPEWYPNNNPRYLEMADLAKIFQAQHYSSENDLENLRAVLEAAPWTVNQPWTAQEWLPITQAACSHGDRKLIEFLLDVGADPTLTVGGPGQEATVPEMARWGGNDELAEWLEEVFEHRSVESTK